MKPAVAVLSTGSVCFPLNRPVLAFYQGKVIKHLYVESHPIRVSHSFSVMLNYFFLPVLLKEAGGKLAVLGSCHMFSDQYIDKEENSKILVSQPIWKYM